MSDWIWLAILVLPVGYLRLVAHELSHVVTTIVLGGTVYWKGFRPWPTKHEGRRYWGLSFRKDMPGEIDDLLVSMAPLVRAWFGMLAWIAPAIAWPPLWVCVAWEATDIIHWWRGWAKHPLWDGGKVREILWQLRIRQELPRMNLQLSGRATRDPDDPKRIVDMEVTGARLVPQDNDIPAFLREAATYDAEKLKAHKDLWDGLPGAEVEDKE